MIISKEEEGKGLTYILHDILHPTGKRSRREQELRGVLIFLES